MNNTLMKPLWQLLIATVLSARLPAARRVRRHTAAALDGRARSSGPSHRPRGEVTGPRRTTPSGAGRRRRHGVGDSAMLVASSETGFRALLG